MLLFRAHLVLDMFFFSSKVASAFLLFRIIIFANLAENIFFKFLDKDGGQKSGDLASSKGVLENCRHKGPCRVFFRDSSCSDLKLRGKEEGFCTLMTFFVNSERLFCGFY